MVITNMINVNSDESQLEAAAGAAGTHVVDAFELLSNETRLAILLALWEAYDPHDADDTIAFSKLYDRIDVRDSGNFTYHLNKLVGHFIEETDEGYRLRNTGLKIVQAAITGAGFEENTLPPTEVPMSCYRCGAPVKISYKNQHLYHVCTECEGNTGPDFVDQRPVGTLMMFDFAPAGLTDRTPGDVFLAATIKSLRDFGSLIRGICPECSGPIEESVYICDSHNAPTGTVCATCGTGDEVRVRYVCSVCKYGDSYPVHTAIYDHPAVIAFCYNRGIVTTYTLDDPEACGELWDHLPKREYTLVSKDPVRIRISVPADGEVLRLTLDENLTVVDIVEEDRETDTESPAEACRSVPPEGRDDSHSFGNRGSEDGALLPDKEDCLQSLRRQRWPDGVTCPHCGGTNTIKKGRTSKGAQRYRCRDCESIFNDLTGTIFADHRLSLSEMFYIIRKTDELKTTHLARQLDRSYKSVLDFVHKIDDVHKQDDHPLFSPSMKPLNSV
jgi:transposase-like protein